MLVIQIWCHNSCIFDSVWHKAEQTSNYMDIGHRPTKRLDDQSMAEVLSTLLHCGRWNIDQYQLDHRIGIEIIETIVAHHLINRFSARIFPWQTYRWQHTKVIVHKNQFSWVFDGQEGRNIKTVNKAILVESRQTEPENHKLSTENNENIQMTINHAILIIKKKCLKRVYVYIYMLEFDSFRNAGLIKTTLKSFLHVKCWIIYFNCYFGLSLRSFGNISYCGRVRWTRRA